MGSGHSRACPGQHGRCRTRAGHQWRLAGRAVRDHANIRKHRQGQAGGDPKERARLLRESNKRGARWPRKLGVLPAHPPHRGLSDGGPPYAHGPPAVRRRQRHPTGDCGLCEKPASGRTNVSLTRAHTANPATRIACRHGGTLIRRDSCGRCEHAIRNPQERHVPRA